MNACYQNIYMIRYGNKPNNTWKWDEILYKKEIYVNERKFMIFYDFMQESEFLIK